MTVIFSPVHFTELKYLCFQIWQSTAHALLELSVVHIIMVTVPATSTYFYLKVPILHLISSIVRDRFYQFVNKFYFFFTLMVTSWTDRKQRRSSTAGILILNIVFFPIAFAVVAIASVLSAPLLCLFTLPLFFIGYPRPSKFWPEPVGASANTCSDTLYYRQLSLELTKALRSAFANGAMGKW